MSRVSDGTSALPTPTVGRPLTESSLRSGSVTTESQVRSGISATHRHRPRSAVGRGTPRPPTNVGATRVGHARFLQDGPGFRLKRHPSGNESSPERLPNHQLAVEWLTRCSRGAWRSRAPDMSGRARIPPMMPRSSSAWLTSSSRVECADRELVKEGTWGDDLHSWDGVQSVGSEARHPTTRFGDLAQARWSQQCEIRGRPRARSASATCRCWTSPSLDGCAARAPAG